MYVENVRSVLGVSTETAVDACEAAVRQGLFRRRIEIISPDGSIATSASCEEDLPRTISYWKHDENEIDEVEMETSSLRKLLSYSLR